MFKLFEKILPRFRKDIPDTESYAPYTITFTGVDEKTDLDRLVDIQKRYPYAEFGILVSKKRTGSGDPRYPDLAILENLKKYKGLNLSCHVCGGDLLGPCTDNGFETLDEFLNGNLSMFRRIQLNFGPRDLRETKAVRKNFGIGAHEGVEEVIIQQMNPDDSHSVESIFEPHRTKLSCLIDPSGGLGRETEFFPKRRPLRTGYAGGINPSNAAKKFLQLKNSGVCRDFWIDMESGVRTDDWFDLDKVEAVLKEIDPLQKILNQKPYPEMSECLLGKEPETIHHNITVPRKSFKEYREGLFYFITQSTSSSASEKKFAEAMLEKFSEDKEEIEITKVEAVSLIELYNTIKEKDLFENTIIECYREQQIGAMWEFVWPIAKAYGLKID